MFVANIPFFLRVFIYLGNQKFRFNPSKNEYLFPLGLKRLLMYVPVNLKVVIRKDKLNDYGLKVHRFE